MHLKKLMILAAAPMVLLASHAVYADGFYVGVNGGRVVADSHLDTVFPAAPVSNADFSIHLAGWDYGALVGYQWLFEHAKIPVSLDVRGGESTLKNRGKFLTFSPNHYLYQKHYDLSLNAGTGYRLGPVTYKALLGLVLSKLSRSGNEFNAWGNNYDKLAPGLQTGLVVETRLSQHAPVSFSATYLYDYYAHIKTEANSSVVLDKTKERYQSQSFLLGLSYTFDTGPSPAVLVGHDMASPLGLYLGAQVGYDMSLMEEEFVNLQAKSFGMTGMTGVIGGGYVGYNLFSSFQDHLNLGLEAFGNLSDSKCSVTSPNNAANDYTYKFKNNFGISINPGVYINRDYLLYAKLGVASGKFDITGPAAADSSKSAFKKRKDGYIFGAGLSANLIRFNNGGEIRGRIDYDYGLYDHLRSVVLGSNFIFKPRTSDFMFGLTYYL